MLYKVKGKITGKAVLKQKKNLSPVNLTYI